MSSTIAQHRPHSNQSVIGTVLALICLALIVGIAIYFSVGRRSGALREPAAGFQQMLERRGQGHKDPLCLP